MQPFSPVDDGEHLPVYEAWDVKAQDTLPQSSLLQSPPFQTWEGSMYQSAPMGRDAHLPPDHDDNVVHTINQPQRYSPRHQSSSSGYLSGGHTPASPHPSSSFSSAPSTPTSRPPLPSTPDQASRAPVPQTKRSSRVFPSSTDPRFARSDTKPRGARSARRTHSVSIGITESMARSSQMVPSPSTDSPTYEVFSPQGEAPPPFSESVQDPLYSLDEELSRLSIVSEVSTVHSQTPSIPEVEEETDHYQAGEDSDLTQILYGSRESTAGSQSAPAHRQSFDTDHSLPNEPDLAVSSPGPHQRHSLPVRTSPSPSFSQISPAFTPAPPPAPPPAAVPNTAGLSTFKHGGPRILPPTNHFDHKIAYAPEQPNSVSPSAFYNSSMGTLMSVGGFKSKPGRDRSATSVGPGTRPAMRDNMSGLTSMNHPRSPSPPSSVRSGGSVGIGPGGVQLPTNIGSNGLVNTRHSLIPSEFGGIGGTSNFGSRPPNPQPYPAPQDVPSHAPNAAFRPMVPPLDPNMGSGAQPRAPLAPGYVPRPDQFAGVGNQNYPAMNAGRGINGPNGGRGVAGNLMQGQYGQQTWPFPGSTNANVYGVGRGTNPWG